MAQSAHTALMTDREKELYEALHELVRLKELKDDYDRSKQRRGYVYKRDKEEVARVDALKAEYDRRKPLAWHNAKKLVLQAM